METINPNTQEEQGNAMDSLNENDQNTASAYNGPSDDTLDQDGSLEEGEESPAGLDDEDDDLLDEDDESDDLTDDDDDLLDEDDDLTEDDEVDESANDADGNGGYPDVANPVETNS